MSFFVFFLITLFDAIGIAYFIKKGVGRTAAMVNLSLIFLLYVMGLFLHLEIGMYIFFALSMALFILTTVFVIKKQDYKRLFDIVKSPIFVFYALFGLMAGVAFYYKFSNDFDEMSHWALLIKNMTYYNNFGNVGDTTTMFNRYVPGTGIFMYAFQFFNDGFINGNCYAAFDVLLVSMLLPLAEKFGTAKPVLLYTSLLAPIAFIILLKYNVFFNLMVDSMVGVMGAYIYLIYFADRGKATPVTITEISLGCFAAVMTKSVGLAIAAIALILIIIDVIIRGRKELVAFFKKPYNWAIVSLPILTIVFAKLSWNIYCNHYQVRAGWNVSELTPSSLLSYLQSPNEFQSTVTAHFWKTFFIGNVYYDQRILQQPFVLFFPIYTALFILVLLKGKDKKLMSIGLFVYTIIAIVIYAVANLILYVFSFAYDESLRLSCYPRYTSIIFTMMGLIWTGYLCENLLTDVKMSYNKSIIFVRTIKTALVCAVIAISLSGFFLFRTEYNRITGYYSEWIDALNQCSDTDRIYYANTSDDNFIDYLLIRYIATPVRCSGWQEGGSYAEGRSGPIYTGNPFHMTRTLEELEAELNNYDYFFVDNATDEFVSKYGALFDGEVKEKVLYKINRTDDGIILVLK